ncbi:MAG: ATP-binding cassette domain-containing protein [Actinomycetota bacterium]
MTLPSPNRDDAIVGRNVSVRYGTFTAVDDVSLTLGGGRIHALLGQNGAGKTTLARVIAGLQDRLAGELVVNGTALASADRRAARRAGVEMVHQHSALIPDLTVAETLELGNPGRRRLPYRRRNLEATWRQRLLDQDLEIDVSTPVRELSVEMRQSVEIAATDPGPGGVLILDEPTASLPPQRIDALFDRLRRIRDEGRTIVIVLHKLSEVRRVADSVAVLRSGRLVLPPTAASDVGDEELTSHIIGASERVETTATRAAATEPATTEVRRDGLTLSGICADGAGGDRALDGADLDVMGGTITGVAGVEGNGQRTLIEAVVGLRPITAGRLDRSGEDWTALSVARRRDQGLRTVPFDRFDEGSAATLSLWLNAVGWEAHRHRRWRWLPLLSTRSLEAEASVRLASTDVAFQHLSQPAGSLSGGNLQRLILGRELDGAEVMVAAQPTRGLDINGARLVWVALSDLARSGAAALVVSSDLDELIEHCDRIAVMRSGQVVATHERPFDREHIGRDMIGASS